MSQDVSGRQIWLTPALPQLLGLGGGEFEWGGVKVSLGGSNWEGGAAPISCSVPTRGPHGSSA